MSKKIMAVLMVLAIVLTLIMSVPVSAETSHRELLSLPHSPGIPQWESSRQDRIRL